MKLAFGRLAGNALPRRPAHRPASQDMRVQVKDGLTTVGIRVQHHPVPLGRHAGVLGDLAEMDFGLWLPFTGWETLPAVAGLLLAVWGCCVLRPRALAALLVAAALAAPLAAWGLALIARPLFLPRTLIWTALPAR